MYSTGAKFLVSLLVLVGDVQGFQESFLSLNKSLEGRLHAAVPFASPCFSNCNGEPVLQDVALCATIQQNYTSSTFRTQFYSGFMNSQGEECASNAADQCILDFSDPFDSLAFANKSCNQGVISPYYIEIQEPGDVVQAFRFSRSTGIKISIKNSGHDYLQRSSQKSSLALWTRNLQLLAFDMEFHADGCNPGSTTHHAITTGAGINFDEAYRYADENNVTFVGGYATTVGVSGGFVQAGGHSILSPVYGLGVDRVIQYRVVTPDGVYRTANACQNQDLFWALRGGGGGTFGVVMESTHIVEPQLQLVVASVNFPQTSSNILPFLKLLVQNAALWGSQGWGGHIRPSNVIYVNPLLKLTDAQKSFESISDYALAQNGTSTIEMLPSWYAFYQKYLISNQAPTGEGLVLSSRLIPTVLFETSSGRDRIMAYMAQMLDVGLSPYIPVTTPFLYSYISNSTSATPAWRNTLWHLATSQTWAWNSTVEERRAVAALVSNMTMLAEDLAPNSGVYMNECNPWTTDWQEANWGINYPPLLSIKQKYDPDGLLQCWHCVGSDNVISEEGNFGCVRDLSPG
ncbi:MAG: hypothetical protein MMC33_002367 [Icmadophila ericetorum]|nr:hypothetical protein [Icmadophila ericetorum]